MNAPATEAPRWFILYRGPLSSCNYACGYCPFAKTRNSRAELAHDAECLERFVAWTAGRTERIGVLFTPWGEALVHRHYQEALCRLSRLPHVWRVAAQTNLSCRLDWLDAADREAIALWTTYHPDEVPVERFSDQCDGLRRLGIRHSVGVVGRREAFESIAVLRSLLPDDTYLWVNAWKREADYYSADEIARLLRIDPHFHFNLRPHPSLGRACRSGHTAFTVDGRGDMRRCHFIGGVIGNIHAEGFEDALRPRACTLAECRCHIGYVHLDSLGLDAVFGSGLLERIPEGWGDPGGFRVSLSTANG